MGLKETDCNNYIVLIEKYLETIRFDGMVIETSNRKKSVLQNSVISYNTYLHLRCPISVANGVCSTPPMGH